MCRILTEGILNKGTVLSKIEIWKYGKVWVIYREWFDILYSLTYSMYRDIAAVKIDE